LYFHFGLKRSWARGGRAKFGIPPACAAGETGNAVIRKAHPMVCEQLATLGYAIELPGRNSGFRARFRPDSSRESLNAGPPAGRRPEGLL
jgi:hypothetical protein